ncbi:hypothetical protein D3C73_846160 [compost metagenome]
MNSFSRRDSTVPRTMRVTDGVYARPSARMMPYLLAPTTARRPKASNRPGKASSALLKAMMMRSVQPRTKPVSVPMAVPTTMANVTVKRLIQTLLEAPASNRDSSSRPNSSVPSRKSPPGGLSRATKLILSGSCGVQKTPMSAATIIAPTIRPPRSALAGIRFFIRRSLSGRRGDSTGRSAGSPRHRPRPRTTGSPGSPGNRARRWSPPAGAPVREW